MKVPDKEMRKDLKIAAIALIMLLLVPTGMPLLAAAALLAAGPEAWAIAAFWAAYIYWAGESLYYAARHDVNGAFMSATIGMIPVW